MKRITRDGLRGLYEPAPPALFDGVRAALSPLPEGKEQPIVKKKISVSIILAAALAVMSMTALAVGGLNLFRQTVERDSPIVPLPGADEMVVTDLGQTQNAHAVLTVEEAVYDGQGAMVLVRLAPADAEHTALYDPYLQDAPDDVYEKQVMPRRVYLGNMIADRADGTAIDIINEPDRRELFIDGEAVDIPTDIEAARAADLPVFMDGMVMRLTDQEAPEVVARKDGRALIDYDLRLGVTGGSGDADPDGMLADFLPYASRAEGQADGSVLVWFNGVAETAMTDALKLTLTGTTTLDGQALALDELNFTLMRQEPERSFKLAPEADTIPGAVVIRSATVNLSRVRGYFTVEYDLLNDDDVFFHPLDGDGKPLNAGMGWADSDGRHCTEQYEIQAFDDIPETLVLEVTDGEGNVLGSCVCRMEEIG